MRILLIRHGQTEGNRQHRYVGRTDEPLTREAKECLHRKREQFFQTAEHTGNQREEAADEMILPDLVYCSPLLRCRQTASILFPEREVMICADLRETDFGDYEYKNYEELNGNPQYQAWIDSGGMSAPPNGESGDAFRARCCAAFADCVSDAAARNAKTIAVVAHGGTIMAVMERYARPQKTFYEWQLKNGEILQVQCKIETTAQSVKEIMKEDAISLFPETTHV